MNEKQKIPLPLIAKIAKGLEEYFSHSDITNAFLAGGFDSGEMGNKVTRIQRSLKEANSKSQNPLLVLGEFISDFMESDISYNSSYTKFKEDLNNLLAQYNLSYQIGGKIITVENSLVEITSIEKIDHNFIRQQIKKSQEKINNNDFDGAITNARSLTEAIQEEIIKLSGNNFPDYNGDLLKLYKTTKKVLNLSPKQEHPETIKQILTGLNSIITGLAGVSNNMADRHSQKIRPKKHHAKLAVDSAFTFCEFLVNSFEYQTKKGMIKQNEE